MVLLVNKCFYRGEIINILCFGSYAQIIKTATSETNEGAVNMLFNSIIKPISLLNKNGDEYFVAKEEASKLINSKMDVPQEIRRSADAPKVKESIFTYFENCVITKILTSKSKLLSDLVQLINLNLYITDSDKFKLLKNAHENSLDVFLAEIFLYIIQLPNNLSKLVAYNPSSMVEISTEIVPDIVTLAKFRLRLFIETKGYCPNDNCNEPLFFTKNEKTVERFKATRIDPKISSSVYENIIALCPKCHDEYAVSLTQEEIKRLSDIKASLIREASALETAAEIKIEADIAEVLHKIAVAPEGELIPLNYTPVQVTKKIYKNNGMLLRKTLFNVTTYFN